MTSTAMRKKSFALPASATRYNRTLSPIGEILIYVAAASSFTLILSIALALA